MIRLNKTNVLKFAVCVFPLAAILSTTVLANTKPADVKATGVEEDPIFGSADWNPTRDMHQMREMMNRMFDWTEKMAPQANNAFVQEGFAVSPPLDVEEKTDKYVLKLDMPGMDKNKLDIRITDENITVSGERKAQKEDSDQNGFKRFERSYGYFQRTIPIPENVKAEAVTAKYDQGVLEIIMPKLQPTPMQEPAGRKVAIQ